jgi:ABC-type dipeptide/oligopeptide/nickel transport system ATPase component
MITHDLGVIAEAGRPGRGDVRRPVVEQADDRVAFRKHPCTPTPSGPAQLDPQAGRAVPPATEGKLRKSKGMVPASIELPRGCSFALAVATPCRSARAVEAPALWTPSNRTMRSAAGCTAPTIDDHERNIDKSREPARFTSPSKRGFCRAPWGMSTRWTGWTCT